MKTLLILLTLTSCLATAFPAKLRWNPNPEPDILHYRVWCGIELVATVTEPRAAIELPADRLSTLTVTAVNAQGESEHSDPLTVRPITAEDSEDLITWQVKRTFFVPLTAKRFFRFSYPLQ